MPRTLTDLLWRHHPQAQTPAARRRGPRARLSTDDVLVAAIGLADTEGLGEVSLRRLATELGVSTMSIYTHTDSRDDLLVLMADAVRADAVRSTEAPPVLEHPGWRDRVRLLAEGELALLTRHPWLLDVTDERLALGPGTIATYDRQLTALVPLGLDDVTTDAALSFVLDFVRASAHARRRRSRAGELADQWPTLSTELASYVGDDFGLAQRVGAAAGAAMQAPYSAEHAWEFGLGRVLASLADLDTATG